jgi:hypothetical protein
VFRRRNNSPRSKLTEYQKAFMRIYPEVVTRECIYRGSTMLTTTLSHVEWVGGPFMLSSGFPPAVSSVERIEAFGNETDP